MKKTIIFFGILILIFLLISLNTKTNIRIDKALYIERLTVSSDKDNDGINDLEDILQGAKLDALNKPVYKDGYYKGGYPPNNEGVCSDVIWRAFKNAGYNLKDMIDKDISINIKDYPRIEGKPDPNIDFRRVINLTSYFKKYAKILTIEIIPNDVNNLKEWQGGDIVVFDKPKSHIAIISDKRGKDGVPYMIHNSSPYTIENDMLIYWNNNISKIIYHFRFPIENK